MNKLRKNDTVEVIKGKDRGKRGRIIATLSPSGRVLVEGINLVKKHKRQTRQDQKGGIVSIEAPMYVSKLMLVCKSCQKPVRVGFSVSDDKLKSRICKRCKGVI